MILILSEKNKMILMSSEKNIIYSLSGHLHIYTKCEKNEMIARSPKQIFCCKAEKIYLICCEAEKQIQT